MSSALVQFGFQQYKADYSLFIIKKDDSFTILLVYIDDIIVASDLEERITEKKAFLHEKFKINDLGLLRIDVAKSEKGIHINQRKYALDILTGSGLLRSKPCKTPMEQGSKLIKKKGKPLNDPSTYCRMIGKLLYLMITRLDISYSIQTLSQFT